MYSNPARRSRRAIFATLSGVAASAILVPSAFAATATVSGDTLTVTGDNNAAESVTISDQGANARVTSNGGGTLVVAGAGCVAAGNQADCADAALTKIVVNLGNSTDSADTQAYNLPTTIDMGEGDDNYVVTGDAADVVNLGPGNDGGWSDVRTNGGDDRVDGGAGNDYGVMGGPGNDTLIGGSGNDQYFYGEDGDDLLQGGSGGDYGFYGANGSDSIDGQEGDDQEFGGGDGNDTINGGDGDDNDLYGNRGDDTINGGAGDDGLYMELLRFEPSALTDPLNTDRDVYSGGGGSDYLSINNYQSGATISADGVANDGHTTGEQFADNVGQDIERLNGTNYDDTLSSGPNGTYLSGNDGNDVLNGGPNGESIYGGSGNDVENGNGGGDYFGGFGGGSDPGDDVLNGGDGDDVAPTSSGRDTFNGGSGIDEADYANAAGPVSVTLDGAANDGTASEGDNIAPDVENLVGSRFGDTLVGSSVGNLINAGDGNDVINVSGSDADAVLCGAGLDRITADSLDVFATTGDQACEIADINKSGFAGKGPRMSLSFGDLTLGKAKTMPVTIVCPMSAVGGCQGAIDFSPRSGGARSAKRYGRATFITPASTKMIVRVPVSKAARRTLRRNKRLRGTVSLVVIDGRGASYAAKRKMTLRR